jgi:hypothetical protein
MTLSVPGVPASCKKFPHSSQLNCWFTESIFNQFSMFLKTSNALCVCLQYKHPRSIKRVIRSDKPVTLLSLLWSHKCDFGAEPRSRIIATSAVKGLMFFCFVVFPSVGHPLNAVLPCCVFRPQVGRIVLTVSGKVRLTHDLWRQISHRRVWYSP